MEPSEGVRERGVPATRMGREREVEATLWAALGAAVELQIRRSVKSARGRDSRLADR